MKENLSFIPYVNEETLSNEIDSSRVRSYPLHCLKKSSTTLVTTSSALSNFTSPLNTLTLLFTPPHFDSFILNTSSTYASIHISTSNKTHPQNSSLSITSPRSSVLHPTSFCLKLHVSENNFSFESSLVHAIQHLNLNSNKNLDLKNVNESDASSSAFLAELSTPVFDLIFKDATINQPVYISFPFNDVPNAEDVEVYFTDVHSNGLLMDPRFSALLPLLPSLIMNQWVYEHTCAWIPDLLSLSGHTSLCVHIFPKPNTVLPQRLTASTQVHLKTHFQPHFLHFSRYSKWECLASMEKRVGPHIEPLMHQLLEWIQGFLDGNMQHALIHGPSGSGKSFFIRHFAIASDLPYRYFSSPYDFTEVEAFLLTPPLFPALIILDDLAHLSDIQVDHLTYLLDTCTSMLVLGITSTDLPVSLASPHRPSRRFQRKWKFPSLSVQARKHLFLQPFTSFSSSVLQKGIQKTQGWSPSDIKRLLSMATHLHNSSSKESWDTCFLKSLESIQPASFTSYSTKIPKVQFEDLCGFENIIQDLKETILIPFSKKYLDFSCLQEHPHDVLSPIRGIVIHGLPGTGKSHLAYAIVNFLGFHCIAVDVGSLEGIP
ncbi:ATPase AAA domain-containing protein 1 [Coelomomyces lativittatus]|nr:ATPase AAA domain-containing protein 1 [Coelomomyces lativittatus]